MRVSSLVVVDSFFVQLLFSVDCCLTSFILISEVIVTELTAISTYSTYKAGYD